MDEAGAPVAVTAAPDAGGLASLAYRLGEFEQPVTAVIESMTGARFVTTSWSRAAGRWRSPTRSR
jgi:hypothetical protein